MTRIGTLAALLLALAPATGWAAFARIDVVPSAPAPIAAAAAAVAAAAAPLAPTLTPGAAPVPAMTPSLAAPFLAPPISAAPELAAAPAQIAADVAAPALVPAAPARETAEQTLRAVAKPAADIGLEFDGRLPAAPDFDALSPVRVPRAPERWTPPSGLLKPVASLVNAINSARHQQRLANPLPGERITSEEHALRETVTDLHAALAAGRYQEAISAIGQYFHTRAASRWYAENPGYSPYRAQAFAYMRFAERAVLASYGRAFRRSGDAELVAEAVAAARSGRILGHGWRPTAIQEKGSSFCVQNSLFNAIAASVGFARPTAIEDLVAASRAAIDRAPSLDRPATAAEIAGLSRELGLDFGRRDAAQGMDTKSMAEWAKSMGLTLTPAAAPRGDAGWSALFAPGREVLLSLRMFHPRYKHSPEMRSLRGHDFMLLHHEVYLLGAFDSASGTRYYLLQDSGSGRTLIADARELDALTSEVQLLSVSGPVTVPRTP
jgi:hypothetical protein